MEIKVKIFGFLCGELWERYERNLISGNGGKGDEVIRALSREMRYGFCHGSVCQNIKLYHPFYILYINGDEVSKEEFEKRIAAEVREDKVKGVCLKDIRFFVIARSRFLYKQIAEKFKEKGVILGAIELSYRWDSPFKFSVVLPQPQPTARFIFISDEDKSYLLEITGRINIKKPSILLFEPVESAGPVE